MTTEAETQGNFDITGEIPEGWIGDLNAGHIVVAPADRRPELWGRVNVAVFAPNVERETPAGGSPSVVWEELVKALAQTRYQYQTFRFHHAGARPQPTPYETATAIARYRDRLAELRAAAEEEEIEWSESSQQDFQAFVTNNPGWRKGSIVLMDNGNLRAVWDDDNDDDRHLAVQFLGGGHVQYVIFKRREVAEKVSRVAGTDTIDGIKRQVEAFDLGPLVYA